MEPGRSFGRYRLDRRLGQGGMGEVFAAFDTVLERPVAVKILLGDHDAEAHARMLREARAAAALHHPHVVRVYDVGEIEGRPYLAMELLEGESLRACIGDVGVPVARRIEWSCDVARALSAAHQRGLVHRDIKPENVHLGRDGVVRVLDFGIARPIAEPFDDRATTRRAVSLSKQRTDSAIVGTPGYMAPEQLRGEPLTAAADQFAWGVMVYELLSGKSPWEATDILALAAQIASSEPAPLDRVAPVTPAVARVVARCLAKSARDRFPDILAASDALLTASREHDTVALAPMPSLPPARQSARPRVLVGLALAGVAASTVWIATHHRDEPPPASTVVAAPASASAHTTPEALAAYRAGLQALWETGGGAVELRRATELDPAFAPAQLRYALVQYLHEPASARAAFARAFEHRDTLDARDRALLLSMAPMLQNDPPDVAAAIAALAKLSAERPDDAEIAFMLGDVQMSIGQFEAAGKTLERATKLDPTSGRVWAARIEAESYAGNFEASLQLVDTCMKNAPNAVACLRERLYVNDHLGRCLDIEADARRAVAIKPDLAQARWQLVFGLLGAERPAAAVKEAEHAWIAKLEPSRGAAIAAMTDAVLAARDGDFTSAEAAFARWRDARAGTTDRLRQADLAAFGARLAEERGDMPAAAARALAFLDKRSAWEGPTSLDDGLLAHESTVELASIVKAGGGPMNVDSARALLLGEATSVGPGNRGALWEAAWAAGVRTHAEASAAIAALETFGPPPKLHSLLASAARAGHTFALAGDDARAIPLLRLSARSCDLFDDPITITRASLWLGEALERTGDRAGACAAYATVLRRWGRATPRSITAEHARTRSVALACAAP